jgi:transcriptional regulator with XRE-family HTH domain
MSGHEIDQDEMRTRAKELRDLLGVNQQEIATEIGMSTSGYSLYEKGETNRLRPKFARKLARAVARWERELAEQESVDKLTRFEGAPDRDTILDTLKLAKEAGRTDLVMQLLDIVNEVEKLARTGSD